MMNGIEAARILNARGVDFKIIMQRDILYVMADGDVTRIFTECAEYRSEQSLKCWVEDLDDRGEILRKKIKKILFGIVTAIILIIIYFNLIAPVSIVPVNVECINWDATYDSILAFQERYSEGTYDKNTTLVHNFNGILPSDNPKDYVTVYINLNAQNRSFFEDFIIDGAVAKMEENADMALFSYTAAVVETNIAWKLSNTTATIVMDLYVKNYSDEQIEEFIRGLTLKMVCKGKIFEKKVLNIKLSNVDKILTER